MTSKTEQGAAIIATMDHDELFEMEKAIARVRREQNMQQARNALAAMNVTELRQIESAAHHMRRDKQHPDHFRLFDLPAELRNCIYEHLSFLHFRDVSVVKAPGLLFANKQIHSEFKPVLYDRADKVLKVHQCCHKNETPLEPNPTASEVLLASVDKYWKLGSRLGCDSITAIYLTHDRAILGGATGIYGWLELEDMEGEYCVPLRLDVPPGRDDLTYL